jgi:hypothetical protein
MANNPIEQSPQPELPPADDSALSLEQDSQTDETDRAIDEIQHNDSLKLPLRHKYSPKNRLYGKNTLVIKSGRYRQRYLSSL